MSIDSWNAQLLLEGYLQDLNVSFSELRHSFGQELFKLFNVQVQSSGIANDALVVRDITNVKESFINWQFACYEIDFPSENVNISSTFDNVLLSMFPFTNLDRK